MPAQSPPPLSHASSFQALDWLVLGAYFAVIVLTGYIFSRRKGQTTEDYFLGSRRMPVWAVAVSILASSLSAATFIGAPVESYKGDLRYLSANIGGLIAIAIVAVFFIPAFYRHNVATIYGLLERRFGGPSKLASSWMFMIGRVFASGARLYIGAIPLALILFGDLDEKPLHLLVAVAVLTAAGVCYTIIGGISSVIWTEVIQTAVLIGAVLAAAIWLLIKIPVPPGEIYHALATTMTPPGAAPEAQTAKTTLISLSLDPSQPYTLLSAVIGFTLLNIGSYGTDHDLAQRMLTCKSAARGSWSAVMGILIGLPVTTLFMVVGLLLFIFYQRPDLMGGAAPDYQITKELQPKVFPIFVLRHTPDGLAGLIFAGLFAAGLSTLMSALNAMSSAFVNDVYRPTRAGRTEPHYVRVGRLAMAAWGLVLGAFAAFCIFWQRASGDTLIQFALGVMTFAYAGLVGVYLTALFTRRGNNASVLAALTTGFLAVLLMQPIIWKQWAPRVPGCGEWLASLDLAFPWRLTIGTVLAFGVCCLGDPDEAQTTDRERAPH